jgi:plasmid stability protein
MAEQPSKVINIRCARVKPKDKRTTPARSRQAWMQLYEELCPDEVDVIFMICGYKVSPAGNLSRRYIVAQLDRHERAVLEAQAKSHGRSLEKEASGILAAELTRLARAQSGGLEHAAHDGE